MLKNHKDHLQDSIPEISRDGRLPDDLVKKAEKRRRATKLVVLKDVLYLS